MVIIINGRRIDPRYIGKGAHGRELFRHAGAGRGRRAILERDGSVHQIDAHRQYSASELIDKQGRGVKVTSMPDRSKGHQPHTRSPHSKRIITEQVVEIAEKLFKRGVDFDEDNADWLVVPRYQLPPTWHHIARSTAVLIHFPTQFPHVPPVGFYLPADLPVSHDGHLFRFAAHGASSAPIYQDWQWYCLHIEPGAWRSHPNWRHGDNLWTYFRLIAEALGTRG